jgi:hypothetical protein
MGETTDGDPTRRLPRRLVERVERNPFPVIVALSLLAIYVRAPDAFHSPNFWAEDGVTFFREWQEYGARSILEPYNGYLHLVPRLIAALAGVAPLEYTILIFFGSSLVLALWTSVTVYLNSPRQSVRYPLYLLPFLALSATEVLASPTNLQWVLATGLIVVLLNDRRQSTPVLINNLVFVAMSGLTGPFVLFALCAAAGTMALTRTLPKPQRRWLLGAAAATSLVQALFVMEHYAPSGGSAGLVKTYAAFFAILRKSMGGSVEAIVISLTVLVGVVLGQGRRFRIGLLLFGAILILATAIRFSVDDDVFSNGISERYRYVPSVMWLMILVAMAFDTSRRLLRALAAICLILYVAALVDGKLVRNPRVALDDWGETVRAARVHPVHYTFPPGWKVVVKDR